MNVKEKNNLEIKQPHKNLSDKPIQGLAQFLQYTSPFPPPEILSQYAKINPDLVEQIIKLTAIQNDHRIALENKNLDAQINHQMRRDTEAKFGQIFALVISILGITGAIITGCFGQSWASAALSVTALTSLAARFIHGRPDSK